ncbi:MAG: glycosyltransferase family 4 protein [bacterium]
MTRRIAGVIVNTVPYHHARWEAMARSCSTEVHLVEMTSRDEFKVLEFSESSTYLRHTLLNAREDKKMPPCELVRRMSAELDEIKPNVICVSGWGLRVSLAAMRWALLNRVPIVMLSESNEFDEVRSTIKEWMKSRLVGLCSAGLVGGTPQADYLVKLGLPRTSVFVGYDVVDNDFFGVRVNELKESGVRSQKSGGGCSKQYFFACARFGKKKNIPGLIRAYALYRKLTKHSSESSASAFSLGLPGRCSASVTEPSDFDLVIAGEGEQRTEIERVISECGVKDHVQLVGAKGYQELPAYYAGAAVFIHASTTEQWGLVVNEAMASGLPVLVSNRCGCAGDLVREGENGFTFDPYNEEQLADLMVRIASDEVARCQMGARSREIIAEWGPDRFASGMNAAVTVALAADNKKAGFIDRSVLNFVLSR